MLALHPLLIKRGRKKQAKSRNAHRLPSPSRTKMPASFAAAMKARRATSGAMVSPIAL